MILKWEQCPAMRADAVFYADADSKKETLLVRQDGGFLVRGVALHGKDLIVATHFRGSLEDAKDGDGRIEAACALVEAHPNPFASSESKAAWGITASP